jgi:hypothetical protein
VPATRWPTPRRRLGVGEPALVGCSSGPWSAATTGGRRTRRSFVAGIHPVNGDRGSASSGAGRGAGRARTAVRGRRACLSAGVSHPPDEW